MPLLLIQNLPDKMHFRIHNGSDFQKENIGTYNLPSGIWGKHINISTRKHMKIHTR